MISAEGAEGTTNQCFCCAPGNDSAEHKHTSWTVSHRIDTHNIGVRAFGVYDQKTICAEIFSPQLNGCIWEEYERGNGDALLTPIHNGA